MFWPGVEPVRRDDVRDQNLLQSAPQQPFQEAFGVEFYPTIYDKAACLFFSICTGHIFTNGNKRTAVLALDQFLLANEIYLTLPNEEMKQLAERTAEYNIRQENQREVRERIARLLQDNSITFRATFNTKPALNRRLHRIKRTIRRVNQKFSTVGTPTNRVLP